MVSLVEHRHRVNKVLTWNCPVWGTASLTLRGHSANTQSYHKPKSSLYYQRYEDGQHMVSSTRRAPQVRRELNRETRCWSRSLSGYANIRNMSCLRNIYIKKTQANDECIHDEMCNVHRMAGAFSTLVPSRGGTLMVWCLLLVRAKGIDSVYLIMHTWIRRNLWSRRRWSKHFLFCMDVVNGSMLHFELASNDSHRLLVCFVYLKSLGGATLRT